MACPTRESPWCAASSASASKLAAFFARDDVKGDMEDYSKQANLTYGATVLISLLPDANDSAKLADDLCTLKMDRLHAQALMRAFDDAGLKGLSMAQKMAMLRPSHPAGQAIAAAVRNEKGVLHAERLIAIAKPILAQNAGNVPAGRTEAEAARERMLMEKYGGGLSGELRGKLQEFSDTLDYSEKSLAASEEALAERLDALVGGGGFGNPNSAASRKAIANGSKVEDLPNLTRLHVLVAGTNLYLVEEEPEVVADPKSAPRRLFDCGGRFAEDDDALGDGIELIDKFQEWYDSLPENVRSGKTAEQMEKDVFTFLANRRDIDLSAPAEKVFAVFHLD